MEKQQRDQLRKVLEWNPDGQIVPIPGVETMKELLDQIDHLEGELELWEAFRHNMTRAIIP